MLTYDAEAVRFIKDTDKNWGLKEMREDCNIKFEQIEAILKDTMAHDEPRRLTCFRSTLMTLGALAFILLGAGFYA